jgi:hypothetical protein
MISICHVSLWLVHLAAGIALHDAFADLAPILFDPPLVKALVVAHASFDPCLANRGDGALDFRRDIPLHVLSHLCFLVATLSQVLFLIRYKKEPIIVYFKREIPNYWFLLCCYPYLGHDSDGLSPVDCK